MASFFFLILLKRYFCSLLPSAVVALADVYLRVLYREVVVYSPLSAEEHKGRARWGLAVNGVSRSREVPGREGVFRALAQCPVRQGSGNILEHRERHSSFSWPT